MKKSEMAQIKSSYPFVALPVWILKKQQESPGWLSAFEIAALLALQSFAEGMNEDSEVYPSIERISLISSMSERKTISVMKSLIAKRLIQKRERYTPGGRKTNVYKLLIWNLDAPAHFCDQGNAALAALEELGGQGAESAQRVEAGVAKVHETTCQGARGARKQDPLTNNQILNPPLCPPGPKSSPPPPIELPPWTEPYREHLTQWLSNRARKHKLVPEIKASSIRGLEYARSKGVLKQYCEYASEREWQSLGFAGHKEVIDKLAKENGKQNGNGNFARPAMQEIKYTLGI